MVWGETVSNLLEPIKLELREVYAYVPCTPQKPTRTSKCTF